MFDVLKKAKDAIVSSLAPEKASAIRIAKQSGAAYEFAAIKGGHSVAGRKPITSKERDARNKHNRMAKQSRRRNRG